MLPDGYELRPLRQEDSAALAAAYRRNREHLAPWDPARPERFFTDEGHADEVAKQLESTAADRRHAFVLWYGGVVAGRVNIDNINRGVMQSCTLGYWLDHEHLGKGLATAMVEFAVERAREHGLHRVEAGTLLHNTKSQAVLQRAGFQEFGVAEKLLFIAGKWQDHVLFQRILHDEPLGNPQSSTFVEDSVSQNHEIVAPPVVFPAQAAPESAYRTAFDLLVRRAPKEALELLEPALEEEPDNTGLRTLRAWAYLMRAQLQKAESDLSRLVEENPSDDWSRHALGRCLERQSRYAEALPHLRLAAAMSGDPDHGLAALRVERLLAD